MSQKSLDGSDVCVSIHTALRKCCDSKTTTAAYNLIHLITGAEESLVNYLNPWLMFGDRVAYWLAAQMSPKEAWGHAIEELDERWRDKLLERMSKGMSPSDYSREKTYLYTLLPLFQSFSEREIEGAVTFLHE